jgi:hypothetical protein
MKEDSMRRLLTVICIAVCACLLLAPAALGQKNGQNGTTLAGYKTLDICTVSDTTWRYSGVIAVWNEGAIDTSGFTINDFIENKTGAKWVKAYDVFINSKPGEIPAGTNQETALTFLYTQDDAPLAGFIRNNASLTILNHSGNLGKPTGPNPKATYDGSIPPRPCDEQTNFGCTYTQGYWGSKPNVEWPDPYSRTDTFFLSDQTWQEVMDTPVNVSQGYYQLAHQYIAAVLNAAKTVDPAKAPSGVQTTLDLARGWLNTNGPSACTTKGSCGIQKDWAATLDLFNNGLYPGGPGHCGDE